MDLTVIIPARQEQFLNRTVVDVLEHAKGDTEVFVILDGAWPEEPLPQHPKVTVVYLPESIGQRAATNLGARLSQARWIMKLDAHCSVGDGFDVQLMKAAAELEREVVQIPTQHNLHAFDWMCDGCGTRTYQGPTLTRCEACQGSSFHREMVWKPRRGTRTTAWRFDKDLHFQYGGIKQEAGELPETMSCLGACWFLDREWFWELGGLDEGHGSWGQMGTELACKAWLSGGRMVTNTRTCFVHMFRTQGGDFGFPYPLPGRAVEHAREYSKSLWLGGAWPKARRPLSWLVEKFQPVGWELAPAVKTTQTAGVVYYSDGLPDPQILAASRATIEFSGLPIVAVTLKPIDWPAARHVVLSAERGHLTMFRQILAGLEALDTDIAFFAEHDVLYHASHWAFVPPRPDCYYYNVNTWKVDAQSGRAVTYLTKQTSGLCANRQLLIEHYRKRVERVEREGFSRRMGFEPGSHRRAERVDDVPSETWRSACPNLDLRHELNLTSSRWSPEQFRDQRNCQGWMEADDVPGWGRTRGRMGDMLADVVGSIRPEMEMV